MAVKPRKPVPSLSLDFLGGESWSLESSRPEQFTMLVVYRGLHCPICKNYLTDLQRHLSAFEERGIEVIVTSTDNEERTRQAQVDWSVEALPLAHGLSVEKAREWGLYISTSRGVTSLGIEEPALFAEPGLFLIRPDKTLYSANIITMPFARPHFREIQNALDFIIKNDYPARGEA